jgi:hypothetical protein
MRWFSRRRNGFALNRVEIGEQRTVHRDVI